MCPEVCSSGGLLVTSLFLQAGFHDGLFLDMSQECRDWSGPASVLVLGCQHIRSFCLAPWEVNLATTGGSSVSGAVGRKEALLKAGGNTSV